MSPDVAREMAVTQPVHAPVYLREYQQLLLANVLVDRAGRPLHSGSCPTCDSLIDGYTCPGSLLCPRCRAEPGRRCRRPSGHTADRWHASRITAAEAADQRRAATNDLTLLAPWPS
ncbi:zinc finger domain-containing protein [Streptomyces lunaelactis]|uniref:zinc finger domain-containing protein n=1 Tax=Streptomyces lunaelactis TaxID=1535768 RepID=UPI001584640F|nr:hypothetical protein [Streptomyces lunaelactis]NUK16961.1 hypothetical protein [Streptomyces lunaelactis]